MRNPCIIINRDRTVHIAQMNNCDSSTPYLLSYLGASCTSRWSLWFRLGVNNLMNSKYIRIIIIIMVNVSKQWWPTFNSIFMFYIFRLIIINSRNAKHFGTHFTYRNTFLGYYSIRWTIWILHLLICIIYEIRFRPF